MELVYVVVHAGGTITVRLTGEIDLSNNDKLRAVLAEATGTPDVRAVEVDLHKTTFIDSTTIGSLLTARRDAVANDRTFRVVRSQGIVRHVLALAGVLDFLEAHEHDGEV